MMRTSRILMRAAIAVVASLALLLTTAPANAGDVQASEGEVSAESRAGGFRWYDVKVVDSDTLKAVGKAKKWKRRMVLIQRKPANGGSWRTMKQVRTNRKGGFRTRLEAGKHIPCNGKRYKTRAKKKGRANAWKIDRTASGAVRLWSCS